MKQIGKIGLVMLVALTCLAAKTWAVGGDGLYFLQDFEDQTQYPVSQTTTDTLCFVEGQGEWHYLNAWQSTNSSYNVNGSTKNLRLYKKGSYVITPVLNNGVKKVTFYVGRVTPTVYTSSDGGSTWTSASVTMSGNNATVVVESDAVNRIKVANESSKDSDIDNLAVYAQTYDKPITLSTADATDITTESAQVGGSVTENTGVTVLGIGVVWSSINKEPTRNDNVVEYSDPTATEFTVTLTGLKEGSTIYYRSFAAYDDTQVYGPVKSFKVAINDNGQVVDAEGRYFVQDFENLETYPQEKGASDAEYYVAGQGTWIYTNSFSATNSSYIPDGSAHDLRMPKKGSYVITPVLNYGVRNVTFDIGRKAVTAYISKDGGSSWTTVEYSQEGTACTIAVNDLEVNRVKLANDSGSDADIDNLCVTAQAYGTPATVETGGASNITKNSAELSGVITDTGDQAITEAGIIWSLTNSSPTLADNVEKTEDPSVLEFSISITGLKASSTVYYRAYALSSAGYAYGSVQNFQTAEATMPVVQTTEVTKSGSRYKAGGVVTDDGGLDLNSVGIIYGKVSPLSEDNAERVALEPKTKFSTSINLESGSTYYVMAFASTEKGTAYGEEITVVTDEVPETPDQILGDEIWCSPDGNDLTADGSKDKPFFDVQKAIDIADPGDRIWMVAGTYVYDKRININDKNGTEEAPIQLFAYGGRAVLDFSGMPYHKHSDNPYQGVRLTSSYWHFYKIDICNASDNGMLIERNKPTGGSSSDIISRTQDGHDNIIEQCNFYRNGDTGLQIKNLGAFNYIINCDSYENKDEDDGDADGFAPKISVGDGNYMFGCRAWNNSDDGYDVFFKKDGGFSDNKTILMEYCLAYENGIMNGAATSGNGNGFKMGSDQGRMNCILNRCLAVRNLNKGFDQNHNSGDIIMNNCTGIGQTDVGGKSYSYRIYESLASGSVCELTNCIAINDRLTTDKSETDGGKRGQWGRIEVTVATLEQTNDWKCDPGNFLSMDKPEQLISERQEDGTLPEVEYAHIDQENGKALIDAGTNVPENTEKYAASGIVVPAIEYAGSAPDLGAYETDFLLADATKPIDTTNTPTAITTVSASSKQCSIKQTRDGLLIVAVKDANATDKYLLEAYTTDGRLIGTRTFQKATIVKTQGIKGLILVKVKGQNLNHAEKIVVR